MCMIFNYKGKPDYIRLCYKTGRAGVRIDLAAYIYRCISREKLAAAIEKANGDEVTR